MKSTHKDALEIPRLGIELHFGWGLSYLVPKLTPKLTPETYPTLL